MDRFEQARVVVPRTIDCSRDFVRFEMRFRNGIDHGLGLAFVGGVRVEPVFPERFGQNQRDLSCMCPKESEHGRIKTVQVHTHLFGSYSGSSGSGHNSGSPAIAITSSSP